MASKRTKVKLKSSKSHYVRWTFKNKTSTPDRLVLTKYDPVVREPAEFKEQK